MWRAAQAAGRRVAYHTFSHVLDLDISFHLERRTGALSRVLERGTSRISPRQSHQHARVMSHVAAPSVQPSRF